MPSRARSSTASCGYLPRNTGSRCQRLKAPSKRRVAYPGRRRSRRRGRPAPGSPRFRRWPRGCSCGAPAPPSRGRGGGGARPAAPPPGRASPGACIPGSWPRVAMHQGSLWVVQSFTRSPSRMLTASAKATKASAVRRSGQPPASWSRCGRSQWSSVANGRDPGLEQPVHERVVEVEPRLVHRAAPLGHGPRPGHREPVGLHPQPAHQGQVLPPAVVVVAGDASVRAVGDVPGDRGVAIPDALAASVGAGRSLDLVGRGGDAPEEAVGEEASGHGGFAHFVRWANKLSMAVAGVKGGGVAGVTGPVW